MGHSTDIFLNKPADTCICAVCHDVLKEASSLNCGHSFCTECIDSLNLMDSPSCPTCRADITSSNPNYAVRGIIDALDVSCPYGGGECGWNGKVGELQSHGDICMFKVIECGIEGCTHTCKRKDMAAHRSSNEALFKHMELKHERKMNEMEAKLSLRYNGRIDALKIEFNRRLTEMEETYDRKDDERTAEIKSCRNKLRSYKNKVDTLEEKVEVLEMQIGNKSKKRKTSKHSIGIGAAKSEKGTISSSFGQGSNIIYIGFTVLEQKLIQFISKRVGCIGVTYRHGHGVHIDEIRQHFSSRGFTGDDVKAALRKLTFMVVNGLPHYGNIFREDGDNYQYAGSGQSKGSSDGALCDAILYVIKTLGGKL